MLSALVSKLRQQIGINSLVTTSQADVRPSGIVQMQILAAILQKMCCVMAEHYRSDMSSFIQVGSHLSCRVEHQLSTNNGSANAEAL